MLAYAPRLKTLEVRRRLQERGCAGGNSAVYSLVQRLRPRQTRSLCRFEGLARGFSQHDFSEMPVGFADGHRGQIQTFASRLKYSRFACITLVRYQKTATLVRAAARHFARFGGVPSLAVFDFVPGHHIVQGYELTVELVPGIRSRMTGKQLQDRGNLVGHVSKRKRGADPWLETEWRNLDRRNSGVGLEGGRGLGQELSSGGPAC